MYVGETQAATAEHEAASQGDPAEAAQLAKIAGQPLGRVVRGLVGRTRRHRRRRRMVGSGRPTQPGPAPGARRLRPPMARLQRLLRRRRFEPRRLPAVRRRDGHRIWPARRGRARAGRRPQPSCLSAEQQSSYYELLSYAVTRLGESPAVAVYLDAGNAGWQPAATIAARLRQAGVSHARGFSLNVSNFDATGSETAYGGSDRPRTRRRQPLHHRHLPQRQRRGARRSVAQPAGASARRCSDGRDGGARSRRLRLGEAAR